MLRAFVTLLICIILAVGHGALLDSTRLVERSVPFKRGLAYNYPALTQPFHHSTASRVTWAYNWASGPYYNHPENADSRFNPSLRYIPMLWNGNIKLTSIWDSNVADAIASYNADAVLSFNEPDACQSGSACMNVTDAVNAYKRYIQPYKNTVLLGSPAVTNGLAPYGLAWLRRFVKKCLGCRIDFIALHWYGSVLQPDDLKSHILTAHQMFPNKPIWVTEFGTTSGTGKQVMEFLEDVLPWLDSCAYVHRYAYYMDRPGNNYLINSNGSGLNAIGNLYDR